MAFLKSVFMFGCTGSSLWCVRLSLVVVSRVCSLVVVQTLLIAVVSLVAEHGLYGPWASVVAAHEL